ncbi:MAG: hypothetical protein FJZ01_21285 [Candidatus Sericytochromatia bacterium]|nr:hypothetical protein [Candidatus Tanganyikabacteria bacterium]
MTPFRSLALALTAAIAVMAGCPAGPPAGGGSPTPTPGGAGGSQTVPPEPTPTPKPSVTPFTGELGKKSSLAFVAVTFAATDDVQVTVRNLSQADVDLNADRWRLSANNRSTKLSAARTTIAAGGDVKVRVNPAAGCTESATAYCAEVSLGVGRLQGNVALYRGADPRIADYVQWGSGGQDLEGAAVDAKLWQENTFVRVSTDSASISVKVPGNSGYENWE